MTEEEVKDLLKESSKKIKDDFIPSMTNLLMDVFQHGINKGSELGMKVASDASKSKSQSLIKWQIGEPVEEGYYLVTDSLGKIRPDYWGIRLNEGKPYYCWSFYTGNKRVLAWYPVSGFEPYKEETK